MNSVDKSCHRGSNFVNVKWKKRRAVWGIHLRLHFFAFSQ